MSNRNELEKSEIQHYEEGDIDKEAILSDPYIHENLIRGAVEASEAESRMGFVALFKIYYPAAIWSMSLSVALVMEGMDIGLVSLSPEIRVHRLMSRSTISLDSTLISTTLGTPQRMEASISLPTGRPVSTTLRKVARSLVS